MRRLLQGDGGSGGNAGPPCAALRACVRGCNEALIARTDILAEQHCRNFSKWLEPLGIRVGMRTGSRKESGDVPGLVPPGSRNGPLPTLTVGTHALLTAGFDLPKLGLVIID